jgi:hypothetical protein
MRREAEVGSRGKPRRHGGANLGFALDPNVNPQRNCDTGIQVRENATANDGG